MRPARRPMVAPPGGDYAVTAMKTHHKSPSLACLCAGLLLLAGVSATPASAQTGTARETTPPSYDNNSRDNAPRSGEKLKRADRRFFNKAAELGEKEVALSRIAADRAANAEVRAFASEMVRAHTNANQELAALARRKGATSDANEQALKRREMDKKWNEKKADDLDEDYLDAIIDCHEDTVDVLERGAKSKDADIAAYSAKMLPVVQSHLARAEALEDALD